MPAGRPGDLLEGETEQQYQVRKTTQMQWGILYAMILCSGMLFTVAYLGENTIGMKVPGETPCERGVQPINLFSRQTVIDCDVALQLLAARRAAEAAGTGDPVRVRDFRRLQETDVVKARRELLATYSKQPFDENGMERLSPEVIPVHYEHEYYDEGESDDF